MANSVQLTPYFYRKAKRLIKKFPSLNKNLFLLRSELLINPKMGVSYGSNIYKVRIADESKGKRKSSGFRVVTYLINETGADIFLITIFDKSEESSITKDDIKMLISNAEL